VGEGGTDWRRAHGEEEARGAKKMSKHSLHGGEEAVGQGVAQVSRRMRSGEKVRGAALVGATLLRSHYRYEEQCPRLAAALGVEVLLRNESVVEVGSGSGYLLTELGEMGFEVVGLDKDDYIATILPAGIRTLPLVLEEGRGRGGEREGEEEGGGRAGEREGEEARGGQRPDPDKLRGQVCDACWSLGVLAVLCVL
jgi:hypothetical protein